MSWFFGGGAATEHPPQDEGVSRPASHDYASPSSHDTGMHARHERMSAPSDHMNSTGAHAPFQCHTSLKGSREQSHADRLLDPSVTRPAHACPTLTGGARGMSCYDSKKAYTMPPWAQEGNITSTKERVLCSSMGAQGPSGAVYGAP